MLEFRMKHQLFRERERERDIDEDVGLSATRSGLANSLVKVRNVLISFVCGLG